MAIVTVVVEQHAEEASFLWLLRDAAVSQPHYSLADLAKLDNRVEAHLDGLRVAGNAGWEICKKAMEEGDAGEVFAAAVLAFESMEDERLQAVLKAGAGTPEKARGLVSALGWLSFAQAESHIKRLAAAGSPVHRRVGIAAGAVQRQHLGQALMDALDDKDQALKARALRAAGELGFAGSHAYLRKNFSAEDPACRFWASWSAALLFGDADALVILKTIAEAEGPFQEKALQMALRGLDLRTAKAWQAALAENAGLLRLAIIGAGVIGDPELVPWLITQMKARPLARVAGEAFSMITGVDIAYHDLDVRAPEGVEAGPTENPEDEDVAMDPDEDLPWPEPESIQSWWKSQQASFSPGTRYLLGKLITLESLDDVLKVGHQRQRAAAALELALQQREHKLFEVRAPGFRQQQILGKP